MLQNLTIQRQIFIIYRNLKTLTAKCLKYSEFGEPTHVLKICEEKIKKPKNNEVVVKVIAAPINPADINTISGQYPVKPKFPAYGGNECVGDIMSVGTKVEKLKAGDRVIVSNSGLGTWRSIAIYKEKDLLKISNKIGIPEAATLTVNTATAYRLLKDFVELRPGDTVVQNGASTAVGQAVHQLCKIWDMQSVAIIHHCNNICALKTYLTSLGATTILTEEEIRFTDIFDTKIPRPLLGLNSIGGKSANAMIHKLGDKGTLVTYGGFNSKPVVIPSNLLIYKDISFKGFWITRWRKENLLNPEKQRMFDELCELFNCGILKAPLNEMIPLEKYKEAIEASINFKESPSKKYIFDMHTTEIQ